MSQDKIHDALNLLDDDMIETVDKLRTRKKKPKRNLIRWMAIAACFCMIMLGVYAMNHKELLLGAQSGNGETKLTYGAYGSAANLQFASIFVKIISLNEDGFTGEVCKEDTTFYKKGAEVFIQWGNVSEMDIGDIVLVQFDKEKTKESDGIAILQAKDVELVE